MPKRALAPDRDPLSPPTAPRPPQTPDVIPVPLLSRHGAQTVFGRRPTPGRRKLRAQLLLPALAQHSARSTEPAIDKSMDGGVPAQGEHGVLSGGPSLRAWWGAFEPTVGICSVLVPGCEPTCASTPQHTLTLTIHTKMRLSPRYLSAAPQWPCVPAAAPLTKHSAALNPRVVLNNAFLLLVIVTVRNPSVLHLDSLDVCHHLTCSCQLM